MIQSCDNVPPTRKIGDREINEKDLIIEKSKGKYGYKTPDGNWFIEPEFDEAYKFEDGYAKVVKEGLEGWISFDGESAFCPWSEQERCLKDYMRKREKRNGIWEKFKENPVIPITIVFCAAVLAYTFFFE